MDQSPFVLASSNRKGGTGKTSTIFHLGGEFARRGERILLLDCDPQASLSQSFFGSRAIEELEAERSIVALFDDLMDPDPAKVIYETNFPEINIVPATESLTKFNHPEPAAHGFLQDALRQFVREVAAQYSCVLIDTPPNLQLLTWASLVAADYCITPVVPEDYAAQGLIFVKRFIEAVQTTRNGDLRWMGLVIAMVQKRLGVHNVYEQVMRDAYGDLVLTTTVPQAAVFKEAVSLKTPVSLHKAKVTASKVIAQLADEVLERSKPHEVREAA